MIEIGYHGTTTENAQKILKENFKIQKRNPYKYWLGEGIYFFLEDIYAFKRCVHEYKRIFGTEFSTEDAEKMSIIKSTINYENSRILDLTYLRGQAIIDKVYKGMLKSSKYSKILQENRNNAICIVIEYMFKKLKFGKYYDLVKQIYRINIDNYNGISSNKEKGVPQYQLCVKKLDIIENNIIFNYVNNIDMYVKQWNMLINSVPFINIIQDNNNNKNQEIEYINSDNIIYFRGDKYDG